MVLLKPGFWEHFVSVSYEKQQNIWSSLNFLQSGPRKFTKSDFFGIGPRSGRFLIFGELRGCGSFRLSQHLKVLPSPEARPLAAPRPRDIWRQMMDTPPPPLLAQSRHCPSPFQLSHAPLVEVHPALPLLSERLPTEKKHLEN